MKEKKENIKKEYLILGILILISLIVIAIFVFKNSYALEGFGKLYLSCDKLTASGGEEITCVLTGEVASSNQVSSLETSVSLSDNLEFVSFTVSNDNVTNEDDKWQGNGEEGNIQLYTANNKTSVFSIGELKIKVKEDSVNTKESINLVKTYFYDEDFEEHEVIDTELDIKMPQFKSDEYIFEDNYVLVNDKNIKDIIANITTDGCNAEVYTNDVKQTTGTITNGSILKIVSGNKVLKAYDIVYFASNKYDLTKEYILSSVSNIDDIKNDIEVINSNLNINNNQLLLEYDSKVIKTYDILNLISNNHIINIGNNVVIINETTTNNILNNIMSTDNITLSIVNNKLNITYKEKIINELDILSLTSTNYDISLNNKYIYIKNDKISVDIIDDITTSLDMTIDDNKLKLSYNYKTVLTLNIINVTSDDYTVNSTDGYIYTKNITDLDIIKQNTSVENATKTIENNKLIIKNNDILIDEFNLLNISTNNLVNDNYLSLQGELEYAAFLNTIVFNNLSYKVYDDNNNEITSGTIKENYKLKLYSGDILLDTYTIKCEYLNLDDSLEVTENKVIYNLDLNDTYANLINMISTNGNIYILGEDNVKKSSSDLLTTGDKIKIELGSQTVEYTISVLGDSIGNGKVTIASVAKLYQHVKKVKGKEITKEHEILASDVTGDGVINIADVAKLYQYLKEKISSLK